MKSSPTLIRVLALCVIVFMLVIAPPALAQPKLAFEPAFPKLPGFRSPIFMTHIPDDSDRLLVAEQSGRIHWFENKPDVDKTTLACDLSGRIKSGGEEGLLGVAFHPRFKENRQIFVHYTANDNPLRNVIARLTMDETRTKILPASREVVLEVTQPESNHNGGMIAFGKDGFLYIALGDGGGGGDRHGLIGNGQNKNTLLGKILRIDIDQKDAGKAYAIPKDNPFVGEAGTRPEIFALGLRNPWRFSFDRKTGDLWAGDVGQNAWEEIDIIEKGKNYGWNIMEGNHSFRKKRAEDHAGELTPPVAEHPHGQANCITGGYVYRGKAIPALDGWYVYGDYASRLVWVLRINDGKPTAPKYICQAPGSPSSFGEDQAGEVYLVSYSGGLFRLVEAK